jgi:acyl-CoA thioester hydrolase
MTKAATTLPLRADFAFLHPLRVRWSEVDGQGIVFNPNYLVYFDIAINEYQRAIDFTYPDGFAQFGTDMFAVNSSVNFRAPARYDDELIIGVRLAHIGRTSYRVQFAVFRGDELLADGINVYVNATRDGHVPAPVPEPFIAKVTEFEKLKPTR